MAAAATTTNADEAGTKDETDEEAANDDTPTDMFEALIAYTMLSTNED